MLRTLDFSPQPWGATEDLGAGELHDHFHSEGVWAGQGQPKTGDRVICQDTGGTIKVAMMWAWTKAEGVGKRGTKKAEIKGKWKVEDVFVNFLFILSVLFTPLTFV